MTTAEIISFKDYFLTQNTYLDKGFAVAYKDDSTKQIFCRDGEEISSVFANDTFGNYFYLRVDGNIVFTPSIGERLADCSTNKIGYTDRLNMVIVAFAKNVDEWKLINNIRNTCASFTGFTAVPTGCQVIRELITNTELSGIKKEDLQAVLQGLDGFVIVSVNVSLFATYNPTGCIVDPCKDC